MVGEKGYEIVVRNGRFFTVGDNGPEMFPIKKGDIVFSHEQSVELLKNGHTSGRGKAYADGTVGGGRFLGADGHIYSPIQPGDRAWDLIHKCKPLVDKILDGQEELVSNAMIDYQKQIQQITKTINNNNVINNIANNNRNIQPNITFGDIHITCPGVTDKQVAEKLPGLLDEALDKKFSGFSNLADQYSRIR